MKSRIVGCLLLLSSSLSIHAKAPNAVCIGDEGDAFLRGEGSVVNPYLICNKHQLERLSHEVLLLDKSFRLGADLDYRGFPFAIIGEESKPYLGVFDGNGYTLSSVALQVSANTSYLAPFAYVLGGKIENLTINGMTITQSGSTTVGGLVGRAENASLINVHVNGLKMPAPSRSGGLVGDVVNSFLLNCSAQGELLQHFGTDRSGGLAGRVVNSDIFSCSSDVKLSMTSQVADGVSEIGGLIGHSDNSRVREVYATGDIDYSNITPTDSPAGPQVIGGIIGGMSNTLLTQAYYAGKISVKGLSLGGAVGAAVAANFTESVFWDRQVSGMNESAVGESKTTSTMKKKTFWLNQGFDEHIWLIKNNKYPTLFGTN